MKTIALILLCLLVVWWGLLTLITISSHRDRIRAAAKPMTPEELEDSKKLEARISRIYQVRPIDYVLMSPLVFVLLPFYLYHWFVKDPRKNHDHAA
jgi:hypothetical protein